MVKFLKIVFFIGVLLVWSGEVLATNYYISTSGNNTNDGLSVATPKATLANVFSSYNLTSGDIIYVAAGTYSEKNITIGNDDEGFTIQGAALDATGVPTTIFNSNQSGGVWLIFGNNNNDNITIDKIKVQNYKNNISSANGGGIYSNTKDCSGITVSNCYFDNCDAGEGYKGGAIFFLYYTGGTPSNTWNLTNNTFTNCDASAGGGAVYISSGSEIDLNISKCKFFNNSTSAASGSVLFYDSPSLSLLTMTNCLVYGNTLSGNNHGNIYVGPAGCIANLMNCTIADNTAKSSYTGGVYFEAGGSTVTNCILYGNTYKDVTRTAGTIYIKYCCYQNFGTTGYSISNSITTDPGFKNSASNDYSLATTSGCIDKALGPPNLATGIPFDDILSANRPMGLGVDIGAYESDPCSITLSSAVSTTPQTVCINNAITNITYATTNATGASVTGLPAGVSGSWSANVVTITGTPTVDGTFNYTVTLSGGGCTNTSTGTITVTATNTVGAASSSPTLCVNTALTDITHAITGATGISNSGVSGANGLPAGVSATWSSNTITISGTPTSAVGSPFNYSIPLTGGCGTVNATGTINVNTNATATAGVALGAICQGATSSAMGGSVGGSATGGTWSGGAGTWTNANDPSTATYTAGASESGSITLTLTTSGGSCGTTATKTITVNVKPSAPTATTTQPTCLVSTGSVSVTAPAPGTGISYTLTGTSPVVAAVNNITGAFSSLVEGAYSLTTTNGSNCTSTSTSITINAQPTIPSANSGPTLTAICQGATSAAMGGSIGGSAIGGTWSGGAGTWTNTNNPATATYTAGASESGSITLTLTTSGGSCGNSVVTKTIMVTPNLTPTVSITSSDADYLICLGTSVTFTPTPIHGGTNPTYQWKLNSANVVGSSDGTYTNTSLQDGDIVSVVMTSDLTCVTTTTANSNIITIRTGTNIAPSFTVKSAICTGEVYTLPTSSTDLPAITGTWDFPVDATNTKEYTFTPDVIGCYGKAKVTLKVNPLPVMTSTVGNYGLCHNTPTDIQFTSSTLNTTFTWKVTQNNNVIGASDGDGSSIKQSLKLSGTSIGTVEYVVTPMANNCPGSNETIRLTVHPVVTPSVKIDVTNGIPINATKDTITLCPDYNVSFKAIPTNAGNAPTYEWKLNTIKVGSTSTLSTSKIKNKDSIFLIMRSNQVCASPVTVYSNVIHAIVKTDPLEVTASPSTSCITPNGSITFTGNSTGNIEWSKDNVSLGTANNVSISNPNNPFVINNLKDGTYNISFNSQGCTYTYDATISAPNIPKSATKIAWSKNAPICTGDSVELTALFPGVTPTSFLWMKKNNTVYDTVSKTKATIWVKDPGVYGVKLVKSGCVSSRLDTTVTFIAKPTKLAKTLVIHPTCTQSMGSVTLGGLPTGGWKITATPSFGMPISGTGLTKTLPNLNPATTYSIRVQNTTDGCFSDTTNVTIKQNIIAPSAPKFTIIQQPTCVVKVGSVLLSDLPKGKWTMTSTPVTKTFTEKNTLTQFVDSLKDNTTYTFVVKDSNGCESTASLAVPVNTFYGKPATLSGNSLQPFCTSSKPNISSLNSLGAISPIWYKDISSSDKYLSTEALVHDGKYYLSQTIKGCESDRVLVTVKLNAGPKIPVLSAITYCANVYAKGSDLISKINLSSSTVRIFDGLLGGQFVDFSDTLQTKTYYVEADSALCYNEVRQKIEVKILPGTLPNLTTTTPAICTGSTITFADVSKEVGSASGLVWYSTKTGGAAINLTDKLTYPPISQTYYAAYKPNQVGICESKERVKVTITFVPTPIGVTMSENSYKPCKDAIETVANLPTAPHPSNSIDWFISPTAFNPLKTTDQLYSTKYYAASYTKDNVTSKKCYSSTKYVVDVNLYDVAFIVHPENSVCEKNTGVLTIVKNEMHGYPPFKISVSDQNGNVVSNDLKTSNLPIGEYTIQVTDIKNCKQKVKETIGCTVYKIPHVITPDDATGTNDRWKIHYYEKYPNVQVTIFNRWGSKVYASAIPYMDDWDGRASSEIQTIGEGYLPAGTYYYVINKGNGDAVESGYIELLK